MNENLLQFLETLRDDAKLQEKMALCSSADEAYKLASEIQNGFTQEEFVDAMKKINKVSTDSELTAEELEQVSGGSDIPSWVSIGTGIISYAASHAL